MPLVCVAPLPSAGGPCAAPIGALATCARFLPPMLGFFPPDPCPDGALTSYHWPDVWPSRYVREHEPSHGWIRDCAAIEARRSAAFDAGRREGVD